MDRRLLSPLHVSIGLIVVLRMYEALHENRHKRQFQLGVSMALAVFGIVSVCRTMNWIGKASLDGREYASARRKDSETLHEFHDHPRSARIISNDAGALSLYLNHSAFYFP